MARFTDWIKEHPFAAALLGLGLGWAIKVSLKEYIPEHMEPRSRQPEGREPQSPRPGIVQGPARQAELRQANSQGAGSYS